MSSLSPSKKRKTFFNIKKPMLEYLINFLNYTSYFNLSKISRRFREIIKNNNNFKELLTFYIKIKELHGDTIKEFPNIDISNLLIENKNNFPLLTSFSDVLVKEKIDKIITTKILDNFEQIKILINHPFCFSSLCFYQNTKKKQLSSSMNDEQLSENFFIQPFNENIHFFPLLSNYFKENKLCEKIRNIEIDGFSQVSPITYESLTSILTEIENISYKNLCIHSYKRLISFISYSNFNKLTKFELHNVRASYGQECLIYLGRLRSLKKLTFIESNITSEIFLFISLNLKLTEINFSSIVLTDGRDTIKLLFSMHSLEKITLSKCNIKNKDVEKLDLIDVGIENIKLMYINLTNNLLSDKGIYYVSRFTSKIKTIELIDIRNNLYNREKIGQEVKNNIIDNRMII